MSRARPPPERPCLRDVASAPFPWELMGGRRPDRSSPGGCPVLRPFTSASASDARPSGATPTSLPPARSRPGAGARTAVKTPGRRICTCRWRGQPLARRPPRTSFYQQRFLHRLPRHAAKIPAPLPALPRNPAACTTPEFEQAGDGGSRAAPGAERPVASLRRTRPPSAQFSLRLFSARPLEPPCNQQPWPPIRCEFFFPPSRFAGGRGRIRPIPPHGTPNHDPRASRGRVRRL